MCYTTAILIEWICDGQLCAWINLADYNFNNSICCARNRKETRQDHNHIPQQPQMATKINKMILALANFIASYTILLEGRVIRYCRAFPHMVLGLMQWGSHPIPMPPWLLEQWNHLALCHHRTDQECRHHSRKTPGTAPCRTITCQHSLPAPPHLVPDLAKEGQQLYVLQGHFHTDHSAVVFAKACNLQQKVK